jgi:YXWGXW repeat-containing protein
MKTIVIPLALLAAFAFGGCVEERVVYRDRPVGPPPPVIVEERGYAPYVGAVWVSGHWAWQKHHWVWIRGHWRRAYY